MKKFILPLLLLGSSLASNAAVIKVSGAPANSQLWIQRNVVELLLTPDQGNLTPLEVMTDANGNVTVADTTQRNILYTLVFDEFEDKNMPELFMTPSDEVSLTYSAGSAFPSISGSQQVVDIASLSAEVNELANEFQTLAKSDTISDLQRRAAYDTLFANLRCLAETNLSNPGVVFLAVKLPAQMSDEFFDNIAPEAYSGIMAPIYNILKANVNSYRAKQAAKAAIAPGHPAPDFTLPNLEGKPVSLSSLRGKFVIIDFWGSWCGWCIKGFPALKENYAELKNKVEVLGVDCGDTEEKWRDAVAQYSLPWINVREAKDSEIRPSVLYGVEGFPTKIIIGPDGNILNVTVGENPEFFTTLRELLSPQ